MPLETTGVQQGFAVVSLINGYCLNYYVVLVISITFLNIACSTYVTRYCVPLDCPDRLCRFQGGSV